MVDFTQIVPNVLRPYDMTTIGSTSETPKRATEVSQVSDDQGKVCFSWNISDISVFGGDPGRLM